MNTQNINFNTQKSILQKIELEEFFKIGVEVYVKRDDLIHELVSGNKWRKLKYNIHEAFQNKAQGILTFGGAFSNHLVATAAACKEFGLKSLGFVRGDELNSNSNPTLKQCHDLGMELVFLDRLTYNLRNDYEYIKELRNTYSNFHVVPEGGANYYGLIGCQEIWNEIEVDCTHLFVAQGTTSTSCGLLLGMKENISLHVVPVLKGFDSKAEMQNLLNLVTFDADISNEYLNNCIIHSEYHFGAYAKYTDELLNFIREIYKKTSLPLDHVYTGKAFFAMYDWILKQKDLSGQKIVFLHTGGLQGSDFYKSV